MSDETPRDDLIELPLGHKPSWENVDKGDGEAQPPHAQPPQAEPPPPRRRRRSGWIVALLVVAGVAAWYLSAPRVAFDVESAAFDELRVGELSEPLAVTVANEGWRGLRIDSLGVAGAGSTHFRTVADECSGSELPRDGECRVELRFAPQEPGVHAASLELGVGMARGTPELAVEGRGVAPGVASRPDRLDFGSESVGATSPGRDLELVNSGSALLHVERVTLEGSDGEFRLVGNDCSRAELDPQESCSLRLVFRPALLGQREGFVEVESDAFGGTARIAIVGRGSGPDLAIEPEGLDFGSQRVGTRSEPRILSLTNTGDEPLRISRLRIADGGSFRLESESCGGSSLGTGQTCRAEITFAPGGEGAARSSLEIREASGGMAPGVGLRGRGVSPRVSLSTRSMTFDPVLVGEETSPRRLMLENSGTASLAVGEVRLGGESRGAFAVVDDGCSTESLQPGGRCEISIAFRPDGAGELSGRLVLPSDAPGEAPQVALAGRGRAPVLAVGRSRLDFAAVRQTESQDLRVEIANDGDAELRLERLSVGGDAQDDFTLASDGCSDTPLGPSKSCWVVVRFSPLGNGPRGARLIVRSNAVGGERTLALQGIGRPAPEPAISVRPSRLAFGAQPSGRRSEVLTIEVTSAGEGRLVLERIRLVGSARDEFAVVPGTCQGLPYLVGGGECTFGVRFVPSTIGAVSARLLIEHNAPGGDVEIELVGEGL